MKLQTERMIAQKDGAIGWITFNNPARHNAVSLPMWQGLFDAVSAFGEDEEVRVIVLKGAGDKAFVSGADISEFEEKRSNAENIAAYNAVSHQATGWMMVVVTGIACGAEAVLSGCQPHATSPTTPARTRPLARKCDAIDRLAAFIHTNRRV